MIQVPELRILIVDDFLEWRCQVRKILQTRPEWKIISEVCDGLDAVKKADELQPDIVLLDLGLPTMNGIDVAVIIRQRCPNSKIIFLTENSDSEIRDAAMNTGASGYVLKSNADRDLLDSIAAAIRDH